ncbi:unnamed protein product [Schistosoma curassoni]|uniref:Integrase and RNaseH domain-containing protein n=1 Tax=Schistosoma curassoni TaxID=6186 RepID=A0A183KDY2_9TREM|nr:unnamed protein product [Schistosoma curassoni]
MEPAMEKLDIHSTSEAFQYYFERFEIWAMNKEDDEDVNSVAHFLTFIGKEAYSLLRTLAMSEKPISLPYTTLKELLLDYVNYTNFECGKRGRSRKMIHEDIKNSTTLLRHPDPVHTQGYADNSLRSCNAFHDDGHKFDSAGSYGSSELNEIQNSCHTTVPNQPTYQISHVIVSNMAFPNDSHISDEISYKSEENMLNEPSHDEKPEAVLIDADFSNDPLLCNDILNKFHENVSEESNSDVISYITYLHNAFDPCEKLVQCKARVLNDLDFDYNSDDFTSTAVYPYHKNSSNVYSKQCEKYVLNEATLFIT